MGAISRRKNLHPAQSLVHCLLGDQWLRTLRRFSRAGSPQQSVSEESILAAVRLASVVHGLATVFDTEAVAPSQTAPA